MTDLEDDRTPHDTDDSNSTESDDSMYVRVADVVQEDAGWFGHVTQQCTAACLYVLYVMHGVCYRLLDTFTSPSLQPTSPVCRLRVLEQNLLSTVALAAYGLPQIAIVLAMQRAEMDTMLVDNSYIWTLCMLTLSLMSIYLVRKHELNQDHERLRRTMLWSCFILGSWTAAHRPPYKMTWTVPLAFVQPITLAVICALLMSDNRLTRRRYVMVCVGASCVCAVAMGQVLDMYTKQYIMIVFVHSLLATALTQLSADDLLANTTTSSVTHVLLWAGLETLLVCLLAQKAPPPPCEAPPPDKENALGATMCIGAYMGSNKQKHTHA